MFKINMNAIENTNKGISITFSEKISLAIKNLLETKHLYQSVRILSDEDIKKIISSNSGQFSSPLIDIEYVNMYNGPWHVHQPSQEWKGPIALISMKYRVLSFQIPHLKLFCKKCDRVEAFNCLNGEDTLDFGKDGASKLIGKDNNHTQIFVFSFLCQSCKHIPEVFLVRREGTKLTLSGRSPMEHVEVPRVIPKQLSRFFSGAIVAHQSGETLAGTFLLRVLIEQWVVSQSKIDNLRVDTAIEKYMDSLPEDFKGRCYSLRSLYENLSIDIHTAKGSAELFESAKQQIIEHFDARRIFKL